MIKRILFFYLTILISGSFIILSLADMLDFNGVNMSLKVDKRVFCFFPQGWAFFTRSPREAQVYLLKKKDDKFVSENFYHSSYKNLFGLNRETTRINYELIDAYSNFSKEEFTSGFSNIQCDIIDSVPKKIHYVKNSFDNPRIQGEYIIVLQNLVPYPWIKNLKNEMMPSKSIRFYVY